MTTATSPPEVRVRLRRPHAEQRRFIRSKAKRKVIRAGRRGGKTVGVATLGIEDFLEGRRVLYGAPTQDQVETFWREVKRALQEPIDAGIFYINETRHVIERLGTEQRIRAKTCWNADTLRGDYADLLILDEYQLMNEDAWEIVGAPMLLDNDGDAVFIYTPPSLHARSVTKARDPLHAAKLYTRAEADTTGRMEAFHFRSSDNPHISVRALAEITHDMTALAIRQEIEAEDLNEVPGALWTRENLETTRVPQAPDLVRVVVGVDPPGGATECGIVAVGVARDQQLYVLMDRSRAVSPAQWGEAVVFLYDDLKADRVLGEKNYGGDMVEHTIKTAARQAGFGVSYKSVQATRGKAVRAEPVAAMFEQGRAHLVGTFPRLEEELVMWVPGTTAKSPNRLDALVWACVELMTFGRPRATVIDY